VVLCLVVLAFMTSCTALLMDKTIVAIHSLHQYLLINIDLWIFQCLAYIFFSALLVFTGVMLTKLVSPIAAGSGIPEMKAVLAGIDIPNFLSKRTLFAKVCGCVLAIGANLPVGKEGPFVHASAILAHQLLGLRRFHRLNQIPEARNLMLSAACAVGVSSAFGAPIGGVLFSVEATHSYYISEHYWPAFFCAVVAATFVRALNFEEITYYQPRLGDLSWKMYEMPFFLVLSAGCGVLGALYVKLFQRVVAFRRKREMALLSKAGLLPTWLINLFSADDSSAKRRKAEAATVMFSILVVLVLAFIQFASAGSYLTLAQREVLDDLFWYGSLG
jgi:chloride channel 2